MMTPKDLTDEIKAIFSSNPAEVRQLSKSTGYAYEAYLLTCIGQYLCTNIGGWNWMHPANLPTFARYSGGNIRQRTMNFSYISRVGSRFHIVPGITVQGIGGRHDIDVALLGDARLKGLDLCCPICVPHYPVNVARIPRSSELRVAIEAKNHKGSLSIGVARELVGLQTDLVGQVGTAATDLRLCLVASGGSSSGTSTLLARWGVAEFSHAVPNCPNTAWIRELAELFDSV